MLRRKNSGPGYCRWRQGDRWLFGRCILEWGHPDIWGYLIGEQGLSVRGNRRNQILCMVIKNTYPLVAATPHTPLGKGVKRRIRLMKNNGPIDLKNQAKEASLLGEVIREGSRRLLQANI